MSYIELYPLMQLTNDLKSCVASEIAIRSREDGW
jgi:hypothetical protein